MRPGIAVVALPCLDRKSLSRTVADKMFAIFVNLLLSSHQHNWLHGFRPGDHE
jgi:hypothetical protein